MRNGIFVMYVHKLHMDVPKLEHRTTTFSYGTDYTLLVLGNRSFLPRDRPVSEIRSSTVNCQLFNSKATKGT